MDIKEREYYDLQLAAFLMTVGHPLLRPPYPDQANPNRLVFVFEDTPELQKHALDFFNRTAVINAALFADHLKNLKGYVRELANAKKRARL